MEQAKTVFSIIGIISTCYWVGEAIGKLIARMKKKGE